MKKKNGGTRRSPPTEKTTEKTKAADWTKVRIDGGLWRERFETNRRVSLPIEFENSRRTGALKAYQWSVDKSKPEPPLRYWMGDVGKWIEAAAYTLALRPDAKLARLAERAVRETLKGQKPDGYLRTHPTPEAKRWTDLCHGHEHYDMGHVIEAAVALAEATGRGEFLAAMRRAADLLDANFGGSKGKSRGCDGHPEIELALARLYEATGERRYLALAKFFVDERGRSPRYYDLEQKARGENPLADPHRRQLGADKPYMHLVAHLPLRDQKDADGHAVRALYLYSGAADVARLTGDEKLLSVLRRLWDSIVRRRMYVTGAVGSAKTGECFTFDYDLPNVTAYAETCASVALVFFAHRMLGMDLDGEYGDVMERALHNGVLSGLSLDGRKFFYTNPLTAHPHSSRRPGDRRGLARDEWFDCACCPSNISRLIAGIGRFIYGQGPNLACVHLYAESSAELDLGGRRVRISQKTDYPWDGRVRISVEPGTPGRFTLALRIPGWCKGARLEVNGRAVAVAPITRKGYAHIARVWSPGDRVELTMPMPVERLEANPSVPMDAGRVALQRGPVVYCFEQADNGPDLADLFLPRRSKITARFRPRLLGGCVVLTSKALRRDPAGWQGKLYRPMRSTTRMVNVAAVPYFLWANRSVGEMQVWVRGD